MLARVRGEFPARSAGDAGMVPLTSRETAKGRKSTTQLAALRQVSAAIQRILLRAKRKPGSLHKASVPEDSPALCIGSLEGCLLARCVDRSEEKLCA